MKQRFEFRLRLLIAVLFAMLAFIPILAVSQTISLLIGAETAKQIAWRQHQLKEELKEFQSDLMPKKFLEKQIFKASYAAGTIDNVFERMRYYGTEDPRIVNENTIQLMLDAFRKNGGIEPLVIVAYGANIAKIHYWYGRDLDYLEESEKYRFAAIQALRVGTVSKMQPLDPNDSEYDGVNRANTTLAHGEDGSLARAYYNFCFKHLTSIPYEPPSRGSVYEMSSNRHDFIRLYAYERNIRQGEKVFGGYIIMFSGKDVNPARLMAGALRSENPLIQREFDLEIKISRPEKENTNGQMVEAIDVPAEFAGSFHHFSTSGSVPRQLKVKTDVADILTSARTKTMYLSFVNRLSIICIFAVALNFIFFGFPARFMLRFKILAAMAFVVMLPYCLLLFFVIRLLNGIESLAVYDLQSESLNHMARLQSYYDDQKLQHVLRMLKTRERFIPFVNMSANEFSDMHSHNIVLANTDMDLHFLRQDGFARSLRDRHPGNKLMGKAYSYSGTKILNALGVLSSSNFDNQKNLEFVSMADGFLDVSKQRYYDHQLLTREGIDTNEIGKMEGISRMIFMLIPDQLDNIVGAGFCNTVTLTYTLYRPWEFDFRIYSHETPFTSHRLALSNRRFDESLIDIWPEVSRYDTELTDVLGEALNFIDNGTRMSFDELGRMKFRSWRYFKDDPMVSGIISEGRPDELVRLLMRVFPVILLVLAFLTIVLSADLFSVLFIQPVRALRKGAEAIAAGNYLVRIQSPKSDEFALLADSFNKMAEGLQQREKMRRFVSEDLYQKLSEGEGVRKASYEKVSVLASDIRGFTGISEKRDPQEIVSLLNDYFTEMETAITANGGRIERLVGDAVMAVFYDDDDHSSEEKACRSAFAMRRSLAGLNQRRSESGLFTIENGIGIATGAAASGMAGGATGRMVFTVIGEVTLLAEKLEAATRFVESRIIICADTAARLSGQYDLLPADEYAEVQCFTVQSRGDGHG